MTWLFTRTRWERIVLALIAGAIAYQVFADPIVGTADNRDWWRVTKQIGIGYLPAPGPDATFFKNLQRDYRIVPRENVQYLTSEVLLGRTAVALDRVVARDGHFDVRWMGLVHSVMYLSAIALFLAAFRRRAPWIRACVGVFSLITLTDVRIVAYFNSFYAECAQIIFLIASLGLALLAADDEEPARRRRIYYGAFIASSLLFFFAKTQDLVFAVPFAVIAYRVCPPGRRWLPVAIAALFLGALVWGMKSDAYAVTNNINIGVTLDEEILPHSRTPEKDLQALGDGDRAKVTFSRIAIFYVRRPHRWWNVAKRRMNEAFSHLPLGNFEQVVDATGVTNPYEESQAFSAFSSWKDRHYPRSLWFWIAAIVFYAGVLALKMRRGGPQDVTSALFHLMLVAGCILQFVAVVTFEANGTVKHFFIFNSLVDFVILFAVLDLAPTIRGAAIRTWERTRRRPDSDRRRT